MAVLAFLLLPAAAWSAPSGTFTTVVNNATSPPQILITYTPTVDCAKIIIVQTVKPTLSDADGSNAVDCPFKDWDAYEINDVTTVAGNTSVDHNFCEKDPGYNGDDDPQDKLAGNQQGSKAGDVDPLLVPPQGQGENSGYIIAYSIIPGASTLVLWLAALLMLAVSLRALRRRGTFATALIITLAATALTMSPARAATCVPFASIVAGFPSDYSTYEMKFTWVGEQSKIKQTLGVHGVSRPFSIPDFSPCVLGASRYSNDDGSVTLTLSPAEWNDFMLRLVARPEFQGAGSAATASLSLQILKGFGPATSVFEHVTNRTGARTLLVLLIASLSPGNTPAFTKIAAMKRIYVGDCVNCGP